MPTDLIAEIKRLKAERNAVLLAHNYQIGEVQDIADFTGDSLELSRKAAATEADVIVFCGVYFMAETAAILAPEKTVLIPDPNAGCPMVDMAPVDKVIAFKKQHPGAVVVTYVNSSAAVKAESDYCCTSANAVRVVESLDPAAEILFVPDKYLGSYVAAVTGRRLTLYSGYCPTHARMLDADVRRAREQHPDAEVLVHPECSPAMTALADHVLSTSGMVRRAKESPSREFIVGTEIGMLHRLRKENPDKAFYPVSESGVCPNMKKIDLEKVYWALRDMVHRVTVPEDIRLRAAKAVDRMVAVTGS